MKKLLNYILLTAVLGTFLPYSALAQTTDVGVNITGSVSIDVVTTISANITLDLTTGETTPTYMEIQNNSSVPVNAKITNISTTSEGAPSTFVGQSDKNWKNLSKEETSTYVNFNILGEGQDVSAQDILANAEIDLGTLEAAFIGGGADCGGSICEYIPTSVDKYGNANGIAGYGLYEINANFGKNWSEGDKNFTYQITTVYSQADSYADVTSSFTYPEELPEVTNMYLMFYPNGHLAPEVTSSGEQVVLVINNNGERSDVLEQNYAVNINNTNLVKSTLSETEASFGYLQFGVDMDYGEAMGIPFTLNTLEGSIEGTTHYLKTIVTINGDSQYSYTFIKKVIVYAE